MVTLRLPDAVRARDIILATDVTNIVGAILGTSGYGQQIAMVDLSDSTNYANIFGNKDTSNGRAVKIQYGDNAGTPTTLATFAKAAITHELPTTYKHGDLSDPPSGYTSLGARASDGQIVARISGGAQTLLAAASDSPSTILTTTGDIIYASSANTAARLGIGTTNYTLAVVGGAPSWQPSPTSVLTTTGDLLWASAANTLSRLAIGTARQNLQVNTDANGFAYAASLQSLMTTTGDLVYASAANTPARLAVGTARQALLVNTTADGFAYASSLQSLMTASGDIVYASGANTPARLAKGSDGDYLRLASGVPAWQTVTAANSLVKLDEKSGTGASGIVEFSSISGSYRNLFVTWRGRSDTAATSADVRMTFETSPTAGAYNYQTTFGFGTTTSSAEAIGTNAYIGVGFCAAASSSASVYGGGRITLEEYANTGMFKTVWADCHGATTIGAGGIFVQTVTGLYEATAAIDRIRLTLSAGNWTTTSRFTLYGEPT